MAVPLSIIGIMVDHRGEMAPEVQEIITRHGTEIICRMGVPSPSKEKGLITLVFEGNLDKADAFRKELLEVSGTDVQLMSFPQ